MNSAGPSSKPANLGGSIVLAVDYYTSNSLMEKMCGSSSWKKGDEITVYIYCCRPLDNPIVMTFRMYYTKFFLNEKRKW